MNAKVNRLVRQLTADKKKLSILLALSGVVLLLWGRLMLKQVPKTAMARPEPTARATVTVPDPVVVPQKSAQDRPVVHVELPTRLARDLFWLEVANRQDTQVQKSPVEQADEVTTEEMVARAKALLELQSTIVGTRARALINGVLVSKGQKIQGFTLVEVLDRKVVLEMNGIQVELEM